MFTDSTIKQINDYIIIDGDQKHLIDTGSPISFNPSGIIVIGEKRFDVPHSIPYVSLQYLCERVGCKIDGLLGMDIINKTAMLISLKDGILIFDDDVVYLSHFQMHPLPLFAGGLLSITISVNHLTANLIVDSGAPISYIQPKFVKGLTPEMTREDFSPYIGDFTTETYMCQVDYMADTYNNRKNKQLFGIPPKGISMMLTQLKVDGIIGIDLFKQFRLQLRNGVLYLPPQGI